MTSPEALRTHNYRKILGKTQFVDWPKSIRVNETQYSNDGHLVSVKLEGPIKQKRKVIAGRTARHEAKHIVAAEENGTPVVSATIIPGPGYNGLTELSRPDPIAALAPDATGEEGTGHDVFIASLMTPDVSSASNAARNIINNNEEEVEEVASILQENKTIGRFKIKEAINSVRNKKEEGDKATLFIKSPEGFEQRIPDVDVLNGIVILPPKIQEIPDKSYELPKEGIIFSNN